MTERKSLHWKAFLLALGISTAVFLPFVLYNGGYFIFIGDFNAQQIPFYKVDSAGGPILSRSDQINWSISFIISHFFLIVLKFG